MLSAGALRDPDLGCRREEPADEYTTAGTSLLLLNVDHAGPGELIATRESRRWHCALEDAVRLCGDRGHHALRWSGETIAATCDFTPGGGEAVVAMRWLRVTNEVCKTDEG